MIEGFVIWEIEWVLNMAYWQNFSEDEQYNLRLVHWSYDLILKIVIMVLSILSMCCWNTMKYSIA